MPVRIVPVETPAQRRAFMDLPYRLFADDANWVPPLKLQMAEQFDEKRHAFLRHARYRLFLAERDGQVVGRISAHYEEPSQNGTGSFGWFDCADDPEAAKALVKAARGWLKEQGKSRMQGPYSWNMHEPIGVLIEGFDSPNFLLMNHNPAYYDKLLAGAGLKKRKDLLAFRFEVRNAPEHVLAEHAEAERNPRLKIRHVDLKRFEEELGVVIQIYNTAWKDNWGFSPITPAELRATAKGLKPIVDPEFVLIAEVDGIPAGMAVAVPNVNEAIRDLRGRLAPFGWLRLLWRLKVRRPKTARLLLVGILPEHRGEMSRAILMGLYGRLITVAKRKGYEWGELSWTLEDNDAINRSILRTGSERYKTYRIYEAKV
jgi:hypothetical protein